MRLEVFERLTNLNRNMERVIVNLKRFEAMEGLGRTSIKLFIRDAEKLKLGVNRYLAEMIEADADREAASLDPAHPKDENEEENNRPTN